MKNKSLILYALLLSCTMGLKAATFIDSTVVVNGTDHPLLYSVPDDYQAEHSYPLVIGLHYCGGSAAEFRDAISLVTDSLHMIVACPDYSVSDGGWIPAADTNLFGIIVDSAMQIFSISSDDIYLTGMSCNAEYILRHALSGVYPFKGIFPWDPYNPNINNYNLDSKIPIVLAFGTSDPSASADIAIYKGIVEHEGNINIEMVQGIAHTLNFPSFGAEMVKCLHYLNDTNAITISAIEDVEMLNDETVDVQLEVVHNAGVEFNVRTISSRSSLLPAPEITAIPGTNSYTLSLTPQGTRTGSALIQFEAEELNGTAVEQITFTVTVNAGAPSNAEQTTDRQSFYLYPNPASTFLNIEWTGENAVLIIYDITGKICLNQALTRHGEQISLIGFTPGLYFATVKTSETCTPQKLFIK